MEKIVVFAQKNKAYSYISFDQPGEGEVPVIAFNKYDYPEGRFELDPYNSSYYLSNTTCYDIFEKGSNYYQLLMEKALILITKTVNNSVNKLKKLGYEES